MCESAGRIESNSLIANGAHEHTTKYDDTVRLCGCIGVWKWSAFVGDLINTNLCFPLHWLRWSRVTNRTRSTWQMNCNCYTYALESLSSYWFRNSIRNKPPSSLCVSSERFINVYFTWTKWNTFKRLHLSCVLISICVSVTCMFCIGTWKLSGIVNRVGLVQIQYFKFKWVYVVYASFWQNE